MRALKIGLIAAAAVAVLVPLGWFVAVEVTSYLFTAALCDSTIRARIGSPSGRREVVVFQRSCGAAARDTMNLSIVSKGSGIGISTGNLMMLGNLEPVEFMRGLRVSWADDRTLTFCVDGATLTRRPPSSSEIEGVWVTYDCGTPPP